MARIDSGLCVSPEGRASGLVPDSLEYAACQKGILPTAPTPGSSRAQENIGFIARAFAHMGFPHSDPGDLRSFQRKNGIYQLTITADGGSALPYGSIPRVLLAFVGTEAVRTRSREIYLGRNLSEFLQAKLHMKVTGGERGTITAVREQAWRLFSSTISITTETCDAQQYRKRLRKMLIADDIELWWTRPTGTKESLWESRLELSQNFFDYLVEKPVPVDWGAVRSLRRSPLALDLYFWITHRMSYLRRQTTIAWVGPNSLAEQLGSNYKDDRFGRRDFRLHIIKQLKNVLAVYPTARLEVSQTGLLLRPSPTHIPATQNR